jgi:hypothetical protein
MTAMRRVRIWLAYSTRCRMFTDPQAGDRDLRAQMQDGRRSYRYRQPCGMVTEPKVKPPPPPHLDLSPVSLGWHYDRLPKEFLENAIWNEACDAFVLGDRAVVNLEVEVGSVEEEALPFVVAGSRPIEWLFDGPAVPDTKAEQFPERGRGSGKLVAAETAMLDDLRSGRITPEKLAAMSQKALAARYGVKSRDTATKAREAALREFAAGPAPVAAETPPKAAKTLPKAA